LWTLYLQQNDKWQLAIGSQEPPISINTMCSCVTNHIKPDDGDKDSLWHGWLCEKTSLHYIIHTFEHSVLPILSQNKVTPMYVDQY
jgi:hypothetical protein